MEAKSWIGGEWIFPKGQSKVVYNPSNLHEEVGQIYYSTRQHVLDAEIAAKQGLKKWSKLTSAERGSYLYKLADLLEQNSEELAILASREMGKPITEMKGEVNRGVHLFRYYAAEGVRSNGKVVPATDTNVLQYTVSVPLGIVGIITPWNFPVAIPIWKIAPALITGNAIIWKPADAASLTAAKMIDIFTKANLPDGVINLIIGSGREVGNVLLEEVDLHAVSFTGSTSVGMQVASTCAKRNIKYQTEMGGKNAAVILKDANLEKTIPMIVSGAFRSAGQKCTATSRIIVENEIYPEFIEKIHKAIAEIKVAHALDSTAYFGPVATREQFESVSSYINMARKESEIISEGSYNHDGNNGYYINPMVVTGVKENHALVQEEIFGPLSVVLKADGFDEAIDLCNKTIYGLSASVFTNDLSKAHRFLEEAHVGMVRVNQETAGVEYQAPFGGMKLSSSHTREQGQSALDFYTQIKTCSIKHTF